MKEITGIYSPPRAHWVGNGFPVRSLFTYNRMGPEHVSPFLLLDYAGPRNFPPAKKPRGVGSHPHRGFETVTIVYEGEVEHRDSNGGGGIIRKGDVQWMTAASGIVHQEFHSQAFTERGGPFEVVQLWVNLRAKDKQAPAGYQSIHANDIPTRMLENDSGSMRVIAGACGDTHGPAHTFSPINVWDLRLRRDGVTHLTVPEGHTTLVVVLSGTVQINDCEIMREAEFASLAREGTQIKLEANNDAKLLVLTGEPLDEPVVGYGPFVMNSIEEIHASMHAYEQGRFGVIAESDAVAS